MTRKAAKVVMALYFHNLKLTERFLESDKFIVSEFVEKQDVISHVRLPLTSETEVRPQDASPHKHTNLYVCVHVCMRVR